jgi:hypothetical protein
VTKLPPGRTIVTPRSVISGGAARVSRRVRGHAGMTEALRGLQAAVVASPGEL